MKGRASKRRVRAVCIIILVLGSCLRVGAQAQDEPAQERLQQLRAQELSQASYDELLIEAEQRGLSLDGSRSELERRILDDLGIEAYAPTGESDSEQETRIQQANELQLIQGSDEAGSVVRLSGGVVIRLEDGETGSVHTISADNITINREESVVSASGGVEYTVDRDGDVERFTGDTLTVELENWAGTFLYGVSTRPRAIEGEDFDFRFSGQTISRSPDDVIIIDEGTITSSVADPPNYRITADRIWILDTGDWGLQNSLLYVGRVPMLWFPVFFHPGRPMFLHPAIGSRDGDGAFVQTTVYFSGAREERSQPLSVLQLAEDERTGERVREGLFLRPASEDESPEDSDSTVRLFTDVYSTGSSFLALDARIPDTGIWNETSFFAGAGVSRVRFAAPDGSVSTVYWDAVRQEFVEAPWSRSMFPGIDIPLRFGVNLETGLRTGPLQLNLQFPLFSDAVFERDYLNRGEFIDWGSIIGFSEDETDGPSERSQLLWRVQGSLNPDTQGLQPLFTQAAIQSLNTELSWRRRDIPDENLDPTSSLWASEPFDPPERSFYYPEQLILPGVSATLAGTLLQYPAEESSPPEYDEPSGQPEADLRSPFETGDSEPGDDAERNGRNGSGQRFRLPPVQGNLSVARPEDPFAGDLSYRISPSVTVSGQYLSSSWQTPDDVDYEIEYWEQLRRTEATMSWRASYLSRLASIQGSTSVSDRFRDIFGVSPEVDESRKEDLRIRAFEEHSTVIDNRLTLQSSPLDSRARFEGSEISYSLNARLLQRRFDRFSASNEPIYQTDFVQWERDFIQQHALQLVSTLNALQDRQTLTLRLDLPPLQERGSSELTVRTGIVESGLRLSYTVTDDTEERNFDPLRFTQSITPMPEYRLSHEWTYDVDAARFETARLDLRLSGLTGRLDARRSEAFSFDTLDFTWVGDGTETFRPVQASFSYNESFDPFVFWRNRIRLTPSLQSSISANLLQYTRSNLAFRFNLELDIYQFLNLRFSSDSRNEQLFRYVGPYARQLGLERESFVEDLFRSFYFFDRDARENSAFKLQQLRIDAVHDLGDWDLTLGYRGSPQQTSGTAGDTIEWQGSVELLLQWRPIPEISRDLTISDDEITW